MRTRNLIFVLGALGILFSLPTHAASGGIDGSGGNTTGSTAVEVRYAMDHLKENLNRVFRRFTFPASPIDASVKPLIDTLLGEAIPARENIFIDIGASTYSLKEDGPCVDQDGSTSAAAAVTGQMGGVICFSLPELMKVAPDSLPVQLAALAAHEHLHHFGGTETQALSLQNYFVRDGRTLAFGAPWITQMSAAIERLTANTRAMAALLDRSTPSPLLVCREIGKLNGLDQNLYLADPYSADVPADVNGLILDISVANSNLQAICDGTNVYSQDKVKELLEPLDMAQRILWLSVVGR